MKFENTALITYPSVWAVGDTYQIFVPVNTPTLMWVNVAGESYYDHTNGIMRSDTHIHKITVPMVALDKAGEYTLCYRKMIDRKPYFPVTEETESFTFAFRPYKGGRINIYHLSDTHNRIESPVKAGSFFGEDLDLLILNGDIPDHSGDIQNFNAIYEIAGQITKGEKPAIFSRGNHDTRGFYAERFADFTPTDRGVSYFTVRLGDLWCLILDTAEDKPDDHPEYGNTVCCHSFRMDQTRFLKKVVANAEKEYNAPGVTKRVIISHTPFTRVNRPPFDIEQPLYKEWIAMIGEHIKPDFYLSGHLHTCQVIRPGDEEDSFGQSCPTVVGAIPYRDEWDKFTACAITYDDGITVRFTDQDKNVLETHTL